MRQQKSLAYARSALFKLRSLKGDYVTLREAVERIAGIHLGEIGTSYDELKLIGEKYKLLDEARQLVAELECVPKENVRNLILTIQNNLAQCGKKPCNIGTSDAKLKAWAATA